MKKSILFLLMLILLIGGFLRVYQISTNPPGLYIDEISNGLNAYDILTTGKDQFGVAHPLLFKSLGDYKVPGYIYIIAGSMALFGKNEFAIRFPSALAGTLTLLVVFFLLRGLLEKQATTKKHADILSVLAAGLLAVTPWHIHFSRGGFEAVVALFFYLTGLYLVLLFWKTKKFWQIISVSFLFLGAMYTYDSYRVIIPLTTTFGLVAGIRDRAKRKGIGIATLLLALFALPLFSSSLTPSGQMRFLQTSAFVENPYQSGITKILANSIIFFHNYLSYFSLTYLFRFGDQINRHQVNDLGILYIWQLPFIIAGVYFLKKIKNTAVYSIVFLLLFVGIVPAALTRPSPHTLRFLVGSIPYTLLTTFGIYQIFLQKNKWVRYACFGIGVFALIEFVYYLNYYYVNYPKEALIDWGGACKEVALDTQKEKMLGYRHIVVDKNLDCLPEYFMFYIPHVPIIYATADWKKPSAWKNEKTLYIRPFYGSAHPENLLKNITLPNINHDIFAQLYTL